MQASQASQSSQRGGLRRTSTAEDSSSSSMPAPALPPQLQSAQGSGIRSSSGSGKSSSSRKNPSQQLSQIEKSVTHLLIATKQLLETLTQWSRHQATEAEVSDVYVRLGYEFNIACRAFTSIGVDTADLGPVPDLLRGILEETLSQEASPASLDRFLPKIRDIIINLLHGLKRKQQRLRAKQAKDGSGASESSARQPSIGSSGSGEAGIAQMLDDVPIPRSSSRTPEWRTDSGMAVSDDPPIPVRTSSAHAPPPPYREEFETRTNGSRTRTPDRPPRPDYASSSNSTLSSGALQELSVMGPDDYRPSHLPAYHEQVPTPPPKQQEALAALQRGGDLERRASRRLSAYQLSKQLGASPNGVPVLPQVQNSPIPNRGRDVRESLHAVRTRVSLPSNPRPAKRLPENSPSRLAGTLQKSSDDRSPTPESRKPLADIQEVSSPPAETANNDLSSSHFGRGGAQPLAGGPGLPTPLENGYPAHDLPDAQNLLPKDLPFPEPAREGPLRRPGSGVPFDEVPKRQPSSATSPFVADGSPRPSKELTLFLQYKSKIRKYVLPDGSNDLSIAKLQLAFIEKFSWNTHSNGLDLPEIYIQDPVSGVRHELEDLSDVKDHSVLVLNVEALEEVKKHIDEGLGGIRRMLEGVRTVVDGQQTALQDVSSRQQHTSQEMARLATAPRPTSSPYDRHHSFGSRSPLSPMEISEQASEVRSLKRDLTSVRQSLASFTAGITKSMGTIRHKATEIKARSFDALIPAIDGDNGRAYVNAGRKTVGDDSETIVNRVDDLQDTVEELRKDVVTRGVRPLPRQLETVGKDISSAVAELKKIKEYLRREKPVWTKIWERELELVCTDREFLTLQEELVADLEDDLEKATQTFALVEEATKQQNVNSEPGQGVALRNASRSFIPAALDPLKAKDGVLGELRALAPNHDSRLEAIEKAEKLRKAKDEDNVRTAWGMRTGSRSRSHGKEPAPSAVEPVPVVNSDVLAPANEGTPNGVLAEDKDLPPPPVSKDGDTPLLTSLEFRPEDHDLLAAAPVDGSSLT